MRLSKRLVQVSWWEGLVVGRADCCSGGQSSVKLSSIWLLIGRAGYPPCWLFGLRQPNIGVYLGSLVELMADSGRSHAKEYFPELLLPVSLSSRWATVTPTSAGDLPTLAGRSVSVSPGVTSPSPGSECTQYSVCPLQEWSLCFPQSCQSPANKSHYPSKSVSLGIPPPVAGPTGWEAWHGAQNLHSSRWTSVI